MFIADLHIHSKYSRATSRDMDLEHLAQSARQKGINLLGTGDFTHPLWLAELKQKLQPAEPGLFLYAGLRFILTAEICNIFESRGSIKRIHNLVFLPALESADRLARKLGSYGSVTVDGRPMLQLSADDLAGIVRDIDPDGFLVPAHIWTPHFSLFGSNSGFDRLADCFPKRHGEIFAVETGLSSDPEMNWRLSALDGLALGSNSDAHSPAKIGREVNVFSQPLDYHQLRQVLAEKDDRRFLYTVEYFPEEGKYHYDGHRLCKTALAPEASRRLNNLCPVCGRKVTVGVLHRVLDLADRPEGGRPERAIPFRRMIPLDQIIAFALGKTVDSPAVRDSYQKIIRSLGTEFEILLTIPEADIRAQAEPRLADAVISVRAGRVKVEPGYDGEFGRIEIFPEAAAPQQSTLF
ncbi:MAG TPA: endonuclease Q family protein [bacterium]|nr:endonuclease Q family protein [bacterium]